VLELTAVTGTAGAGEFARPAPAREDSSQPYNFTWDLPEMGTKAKLVRITQLSTEGEQVLYEQPAAPGSRIQLFIPPKQGARVRVFIDGVLIDEK
jgi:hypothetical protein